MEGVYVVRHGAESGLEEHVPLGPGCAEVGRAAEAGRPCLPKGSPTQRPVHSSLGSTHGPTVLSRFLSMPFGTVGMRVREGGCEKTERERERERETCLL